MDLWHFVMFVLRIISRCASSVQGGILGMPSGMPYPYFTDSSLQKGGTKWECVSMRSKGFLATCYATTARRVVSCHKRTLITTNKIITKTVASNRNWVAQPRIF
ncbi:hypothetical protein GGI43DRAFT_419320 [Trichoderma evansii]